LEEEDRPVETVFAVWDAAVTNHQSIRAPRGIRTYRRRLRQPYGPPGTGETSPSTSDGAEAVFVTQLKGHTIMKTLLKGAAALCLVLTMAGCAARHEQLNADGTNAAGWCETWDCAVEKSMEMNAYAYSMQHPSYQCYSDGDYTTCNPY
jgi:hypothetical protein